MSRQSGEVTAIFFQSLVGAFRVLARDTLRPSYLLQRAQEPFLRQTKFFKDAPFLDHGEDDMFDTEIIVFQGPLFVFGLRQDLTEPRCDMELSGACPGPLDLRQLRERLLYRLADGGYRQSCLFEERGGETSILFHKRKQEVLHIYPLMAPPRGMGRRGLERLL